MSILCRQITVLRISVVDGDTSHPRRLELSIEGDAGHHFELANQNRDSKGVVHADVIISTNAMDREDPAIVDSGGLYHFQLKV